MSKDYHDSQLFLSRRTAQNTQGLIQEKLIHLQKSSGKTPQQFAYMLKSMLFGTAYGLGDRQLVRGCTLQGCSETMAQHLLSLVKAANVQSLRLVLKKWSGQDE